MRKRKTLIFKNIIVSNGQMVKEKFMELEEMMKQQIHNGFVINLSCQNVQIAMDRIAGNVIKYNL